MTGFGAQFGLYYDSGTGFKAGASYKTEISFSDFEFDDTYLDNSTGTNEFGMNYPAIYSLGTGYSGKLYDLAVDYRYSDYENTEGFSTTGWTPTASVSGFGWSSISVISAGLQFRGFKYLPVRVGYTFSENPISGEVAMYNVPATALIKHAFQAGIGYEVTRALNLDLVYHFGTSDGNTSGPILNPMMASSSSPYGAVPGSKVSYDMTTSMVMVGVTYRIFR